jgi:DNA polymerase-3 subunit epsilon
MLFRVGEREVLDGEGSSVAELPGGILGRAILDTPIAVLDFETTGLSPGYDRVVEVSVVRIEPGAAPRLVLDTLVKPGRRMAATEIHGITDRDVADAPRFEEIAGDLARALAGCVLAAHNVYFDLKFLRHELGRLGQYRELPHLCTMYVRPLLGLRACNLNAACIADRIAYTPMHTSRSDSTAAALLWIRYREVFRARGLVTFQDLVSLGRTYKFFTSFACGTLPPPGYVAGPCAALKPRA